MNGHAVMIPKTEMLASIKQGQIVISDNEGLRHSGQVEVVVAGPPDDGPG